MRHIAIFSQGAIHPFALRSTCNGTLGAFHKVHSCASRVRQRKAQKACQSQHISPPTPGGRPTTANGFLEMTVASAGEHVPGVKVWKYKNPNLHLWSLFSSVIYAESMQLTVGISKVLCHRALTLPEISQQHHTHCRCDVTSQPPPTAAPRDGLHSDRMRLSKKIFPTTLTKLSLDSFVWRRGAFRCSDKGGVGSFVWLCEPPSLGSLFRCPVRGWGWAAARPSAGLAPAESWGRYFKTRWLHHHSDTGAVTVETAGPLHVYVYVGPALCAVTSETALD